MDYSGHTAQMSMQDGSSFDVTDLKKIDLVEVPGESGRRVAMAKFPLSGLENKSLDGVARLLDPNGRLVKTVYQHVHIRRPDWVDTQEGYSKKVLPPWTPVEAQTEPDGTVDIGAWGCRHVFGTIPFLQKIESSGEDLLAAPIALRGRAEGHAFHWKNGSTRLTAHYPDTASLEQVCESNGVTLHVKASMDYDGYMIFDCTLQGQRGLTIEILQLDIPLRTRYATLCFGQGVYPEKPKIPMSISHSGAVPGDLGFRFSPNIWIGNEQRGLCWQAESDEHWHYADKQKSIEILPRDKVTHFQANLINLPTHLATTRSFTTGSHYWPHPLNRCFEIPGISGS